VGFLGAPRAQDARDHPVPALQEGLPLAAQGLVGLDVQGKGHLGLERRRALQAVQAHIRKPEIRHWGHLHGGPGAQSTTHEVHWE